MTYALLVLALWDGWGMFTKVAVEDLQGTGGAGEENDIVGFFARANFTVGLGYYVLRRRRISAGVRPPTHRLLLHAANTLALALGILAVTFALAQGEASLVSAVSGTYPLLTLAMAFPVLKDHVVPLVRGRPLRPRHRRGRTTGRAGTLAVGGLAGRSRQRPVPR